MKIVKIGEKEFEIKTIKGEPAIELLSMGGQVEKIKEIIKLTIEQGSNAKIEELSLSEILNLIEEINKFNGFVKEDFQKALEKKSGK